MDYSLNITEFPKRNIEHIFLPNSLEELAEVLKKAKESGKPVYPISTGHNWGLGSKLPVTDADILDLRNLNEILEVNEPLAYARIQPGVTQIQLAEYLAEHHPKLILNVTGADANSSILGNTIERGSGKNGHRANDLRGLKVMTINGEIFSTGLGAFPDGLSNGTFYRYGLGPDFTHLFTQSNFGVVVEGVISLLPKQPFDLYLGVFRKPKLGDFLHRFSGLVHKGIVGHSLEIDSVNDPKIFELFEGNESQADWICWFVIYGEQEIREVKSNALKAALNPILEELKMFASEDDHSSSPMPVQVRVSRYNGIPNDHSLLATAKAFGVDLDPDNPDLDLHKNLPGFRCVLPVIPFSREGARIINLIEEFSTTTSFQPAISIIALDNYSLEVFARVYFDRESDEQRNLAGDWSAGLRDALKNTGIYPYRLDIESMHEYLSIENETIKLLKQSIKKHLDPNDLIAPGRYHLISRT